MTRLDKKLMGMVLRLREELIGENRRLRKKLTAEARRRYGDIRPCSRRTFNHCFTRYQKMLIFWFNSADNSTRILCIDVKTEKFIHPAG
jgi:hypothetical protein